MIPEYELKAKDIHQVALQNVKKHFSLTSNGYQCDTEMLFNVLFKAATALVHKSTDRCISTKGSEQLGNFIAFRHPKMGHFIERQTADKSLRCLRFQ